MLLNENIKTFTEAARTLPKVNGKRPHASTLWRWARKGLSGVKLETRRIGSRFVTSSEALERFTKSLAEVELAPRPDTPSTLTNSLSESQRKKAQSTAEAELEAAGI